MASNKGRCVFPGCAKWAQADSRCRVHLKHDGEEPELETVPCYVTQCDGTVQRLVTNRSVRHCPTCRNYLSKGLNPENRFIDWSRAS